MIKKIGLLASIFTFIAFLTAQGPAYAQDQGPLAPEQVDGLVELLEDEEERTQFLDTLKAMQAAQNQNAEQVSPGFGALAMQRVTDGLQAMGDTLSDAIIAVGSPGELGKRIQDQFNEKEARAFWVGLMIAALSAIGGGLIIRFVFVSLLARARASIESRTFPSTPERAFWLAVRTLLDVAPLIAFGLTAYGVLALMDPTPQQRLIVLTLVSAIVVARSLLALIRLAVTPLAPSLRLLPLEDRTAAYLFVWCKRFINVIVYGYFLVEVTILLKTPAAVPALISHITALLALLMFLMLIAQNRRVLQDLRRDQDTDTHAHRFLDHLIGGIADIWHIPAMLYAVIVYGVWAIGQEGGFLFLLEATVGTLIILALTRFLLLGVDRLADRMFKINPDLVRRLPGIEVRANRYQPVVRLVLSAIVGVLAFLSVLEVWGVDVSGLLASDYGRDLLGRVIRIMLITGLAIAVIEVTHLAIAHYLNSQDDEGNQVDRSARMKTLLPLARSAVVVVVGLVGALTIMSEIGIDIAPILAGAGVLGLAVGFGAQTLVKDVITGVFILMEDAIAVGDVVKVAGHSGTVEALSVRSIRLRDLSGVVHTVPFSSVDSVENLTKDFSYYVLDVGVAYRENTDDVIEVLEAIGRDFEQEETVRDDLLGPLEILGVNALGDSAVVIRARLKTRPGHQWRIGREFNRRMKLVFDDMGIEIPFPHQTIYFGEGKDGTAPPVFISNAPDAGASQPSTESRSLDDRVKTLTAKRGRSSDAEVLQEDAE